MSCTPVTPRITLRITSRWLGSLRLLPAILSGLLVLLFAITACRRLRFPFDLEWVEDGNLQQVQRLLHHLPLYAEPTIHYTPYVYAPMFFWVSALAARVTGDSFACMRLVSVLSTLGIFFAIFLLVWQELPQPASVRRLPARLLAGTVAVGLFAAAYPVTDGFFDIGRVDMLSLCFAAFALLAGRRGQPVPAALLWVGAVLAKQGMLPVALLMLVFDWHRPRRIVAGLATFTLVLAGFVGWLNHASHGWFLRNVLGTASGFPFLVRQAIFFVPVDLLAPYPLAVLLCAAALLHVPLPWRSRAVAFYALGGTGLVLFTWYLRSHEGASGNAVLPAYFWLAVVTGISFGRLLALLETRPEPLAGTLLTALLLGISVQLLMQLYNPNVYVPTSAELARRAKLEGQLRTLPDDVLVVDHPQYAVFAGKPPFADGKSVKAVLLSHRGARGLPLLAGFATAVHQHAWSAIILDSEPRPGDLTSWAPTDLRAFYPLRVRLRGSDYERTSQPTWAYLPCPAAGKPDLAAVFSGEPIDASLCR